MRFFSFFSLASAALVFAVTRSAAAAEIAYDAPADCPPRDAALARLGTRGPEARAARIRIAHRSTGGFTADLSLGDDQDDTRHLEGETCEGILDALKLVLSLDAQPSKPVQAAPEPQNPPEKAAVVPPAPVARDETPAAPPRQRSAVELGVGGEFGLRSIAKSTAIETGLFLELAAPALGADWFRPSLRVGATHFSANTMLTRDWGTEPVISVTAAVLDLCPLGTALVSSRVIDLTLSACGIAHIGSGKRAGQSTSWIDGGPTGRIVLQAGLKRRVRGFAGVDVGVVYRLGDRLGGGAGDLLSSAEQNASMWRTGLSGGIVFP